MSDNSNDSSISYWVAVVLGFFPAALLLGITGSRASSEAVLFAAVVSVFCCFTSSFLLFRQKSTLATLGGVVFLLLNGAIAFFLGCGAILSGLR